jgi:hypothetical protein
LLSKEGLSEYKCRACGLIFSSLGDMQHHILVEHHQKGDVVEEKKETEAA